MATRRTSTKVQVPIAINSQQREQFPPSQSRQMPGSSPFLPTILEALLLSVYPLILVLGSAYSLVSPASRSATYHAVSQAYLPAEAPSYFARKNNVFNLYFVKIGWFWITLAFFAWIFTHPHFGRPLSPSLTKRRQSATLRYLSITIAWIAVTQWAFGPSIIDRIFRWTGGQCALMDHFDGDVPGMSDTRQALTHAACKTVGGQWSGGHDISGHVFLLILGSAMLWLEVLPVVLTWGDLREKRRIVHVDGSIVDVGIVEEQKKEIFKSGVEATIAVQAVMMVAVLSCWMLFMTAAYFHTWFEKFTGLIASSLIIYLVYFLPRGIPVLRGILGLPAAP